MRRGKDVIHRKREKHKQEKSPSKKNLITFGLRARRKLWRRLKDTSPGDSRGGKEGNSISGDYYTQTLKSLRPRVRVLLCDGGEKKNLCPIKKGTSEKEEELPGYMRTNNNKERKKASEKLQR